MDEKDFARNPSGVAHGAVDRFLIFNYQLKLQDHIKAVRHILNTGEGVVMEQCPNSDYIYFNAMYNAGWVQPESEYHIHNWVFTTNFFKYGLDASAFLRIPKHLK